MNDDYDDAGMAEPFGPEYVRPANPDCPDCACCTAALCERGRASMNMCTGHVDAAHKPVVAGCVCSSEASRGSLAWRALRIRAVRAATELPLPVPLEAMLRSVAYGRETPDPDGLLDQLVARRMVEAADGGGVQLAEYGRLYLAARTEARTSTAVLVHDVDVRARTARVVVVGRTSERALVVPMDQLANGITGLTPAQLPGVMLHAYANCTTTHDDDVVLTQVSNPRLPATRVATGDLIAGARAARLRQTPDGDQ